MKMKVKLDPGYWKRVDQFHFPWEVIRPDLDQVIKVEGRAGAAWMREVIEAAAEKRFKV